MGVLVKAIGAGVGFVAEVASSNKNKTNITSSANTRPATTTGISSGRDAPEYSQPSQDDDGDSTSSDSSGSEDEKNWALDDEVQRTTSKKEYDFQAQPTIESLVSMVTSGMKPLPHRLLPLAQPVILPQRRPGTRGRGFVRAYAPMLDDLNIDQTTFLTFINNFDEAVKASPFLGVVYLSATVVSVVPHGFAMLAGTVTQVVVGAAMEYQQRSRGNSYMDKINDQLFKPRGLYAVIMSYLPSADRPVTARRTDINDFLSGEKSNSGSLLGPKLQKGESYGELELPDAAPLVFPGIDAVQRRRLLEENVLKRSARWTSDYMDRRGQARWMQQNPESRLNPPAEMKPSFNSTLADPNHPAFQGSWPTLFSGGRIAPKQKLSKDQKRAEKESRRQSKRERKTGFSTGLQTSADGYTNPPQTVPKKSKKRKAKSKILYLMLLPIPSQSELREARQQLEIDGAPSSDDVKPEMH